jgi:hypothetical protein
MQNKRQDRIRQKIKEKTSVTDFCDSNNLNKSTVINFLNGKRNIQSNNLFKILDLLEMDVLNNTPKGFIECDSVLIDGVPHTVGDSFDGKTILMCFCNESKTVFVFGLVNGDKIELKIIE